MDEAGDHDPGLMAASEAATSAEPRLSWDPSVEAVPSARGWDAEPCLLDWCGTAMRTCWSPAAGGPHGRIGLALPPVGPRARARPPATTRACECRSSTVCGACAPSPMIVPAGSTWWRIGDDGLVGLPNEGTSDEPVFGRRVPLGLGADLGIPHARIVQMTAVDWDQDGLTDLLVGVLDLEGTGRIPGGCPPPSRSASTREAGHPCYDREGLWRGRAPRSSLLASQRGDERASPASSSSPRSSANRGGLDLGLHPAPLVVCWGGRGSLELLVSDHRGLLRVYRNFGGQLSPGAHGAANAAMRGRPLLLPDDRVSIAAGDIDGDRQTELVYGTSNGRVYACIPGRRGTRPGRRPRSSTGRAELLVGGHGAIVACDLDADEDLDLVYGDAVGPAPLPARPGHRRRPSVCPAGDARGGRRPVPDGARPRRDAPGAGGPQPRLRSSGGGRLAGSWPARPDRHRRGGRRGAPAQRRRRRPSLGSDTPSPSGARTTP